MSNSLVWHETVDQGAFKITVRADGENPYHGRLVVEVTETGQVLLDKEVPVGYGAIFGPDVDDTFAWSQDALTVIDAYIAANE